MGIAEPGSQSNEIDVKEKPFFLGLFDKLRQQRSSNDSVHEGDEYKQITGLIYFTN